MTNSQDFGNFASRSSSKWRRFAPDVLPMHVAEMDFDVAKEIRDQIVDFANRSDLGYLGPIPEVAQAFAGFAKDRWGWEIDQSQLKLATDVGVAAVEILRAISKPGDKVLINSPVYSAFFNWIEEVGCEAADAPLKITDSGYQLDLTAIEQAFIAGVKIYLLCSPQNPVGLVHSAKDLAEIARLADEHDVIVISDEIHAPLSWVPFTPYLTLGEAAERTGVTISSSSKAWNVAGLKAAFYITQSKKMQLALKDLPVALNWRSSILGAFCMATAFKDSRQWLDDAVSQIQENYLFLESELPKFLPKAKLTPMGSTYLAWIDISAYKVADAQKHILEIGKVALVAGPDHGSREEYQGFVRLNFACSRERISEALRRMALVLEG